MGKLVSIMWLILLLSACTQLPVKKVRNLLEQQIEADNYYAQDMCDKAVPLYKKLSESVPTNINNLLRIGNCYAKQQNYSQAEQAYITVLERAPRYTKAWYNLSYIRAKILAKTVSDMYKNVDISSPEAAKIRILTLEVLAPFNLGLEIEMPSE